MNLFRVCRSKLAATAVALLIAAPSHGAVVPLGVVTHAEQAQLGQAGVSVGSTIYDGDTVSTGTDGSLRITTRTVTLELARQSSLTIRRHSGLDGDILAELVAGILILSTVRNASIALAANHASIRPATNASVVTCVRVVNQRELRIFTQRGSVELSYQGETEVIPEGKTYRVILDPSEKEIAAASESDNGKKSPAKPRRAFLLIAITVLIPAVLVPVIIHLLESPDRPGAKSTPPFSKVP